MKQIRKRLRQLRQKMMHRDRLKLKKMAGTRMKMVILIIMKMVR